jgi:hypothetical protein
VPCPPLPPSAPRIFFFPSSHPVGLFESSFFLSLATDKLRKIQFNLQYVGIQYVALNLARVCWSHGKKKYLAILNVPSFQHGNDRRLKAKCIKILRNTKLVPPSFCVL